MTPRLFGNTVRARVAGMPVAPGVWNRPGVSRGPFHVGFSKDAYRTYCIKTGPYLGGPSAGFRPFRIRAGAATCDRGLTEAIPAWRSHEVCRSNRRRGTRFTAVYDGGSRIWCRARITLSQMRSDTKEVAPTEIKLATPTRSNSATAISSELCRHRYSIPSGASGWT